MLLLVPGDPGGPYWARNRVVYCAIPLVAGLLALAVSSWTAARYDPQADPVHACRSGDSQDSLTISSLHYASNIFILKPSPAPPRRFHILLIRVT